jgi:formylmethanofuran dehydrogenase subunit E
MMPTFDDYLEMAGAMHGSCRCPGQVLGTRMAMLGGARLGIELPDRNKRLLVFVEMDRCFADAIAGITGCRLGKRTLKHLDYGKAACTFYDEHTGRAVRVVARDESRADVADYAPPDLEKYEAQATAYRLMPDDLLFEVQRVQLTIAPEDRPGRPVSRVVCAQCGEGVNDRREVMVQGTPLCQACAGKGYYELIP